MLQAAALSTAGLLAAGVPTKSAAVPYELVWQPRSSTPVGSVRTSYAPTFITYLARFLLNYDRGSAGWWVDQARGLPVSLDRSALKSIREKQFGQFSESIEVGLQKYQGKHGVVALFTVLRNRYGTSPRGKVQLALLFSLIAAANQPRKAISRVLGEGDDGSIESVKLTAQGSGYSSTPPQVDITAPEGGKLWAKARAEVKPTGNIACISLVDGGYLYTTTPAVSISPPALGGKAAKAIARVESGKVVSIEVTDRGSGYSERDIANLQVDIQPPRDENGMIDADGRNAEAMAKMDFCVSQIILEDGGRGYSRDQPVLVFIGSPQESGGQANGVGAAAEASVVSSNEFGPGFGVGPYTEAYQYGSVSAEILKLLPDSLHPLRKSNGFFAFPTSAANSALLLKPSPAADEAAAARARLAGATSVSKSRSPSLNLLREPNFGPLGTSPVQREIPLEPINYFGFAASGAVCTALVRSALVPLDVSKTLMQSDPKKYPALGEAVSSLWADGGLPSLYRSIDVTAVSGILLGSFGFGCNEFLRRYFASIAGVQAQTLYSLQISIAAALGSVLITCLATCPFEVLRIRAIEDAGSVQGQPTIVQHQGALAVLERAAGPYSMIRGLGTLWDEGGLQLLYSALTPLLLRELPFTITKFLVYDATVQTITSLLPMAQEGPLQAALLSLFSGLAAGIAAAAVSTPADTLLTLTQTPHGSAHDGHAATEPVSLSDAFVDQLQKDPLGFFRGLLPRCVFFGVLIAGQFLLYDYLKLVFKVSPNDLLYVLDVFADRLSSYYEQS